MGYCIRHSSTPFAFSIINVKETVLTTTPPTSARTADGHDPLLLPLQHSEKVSHGSFFPKARLAAEVARKLFDSENLIRPTGDLIFKKLMTESPDALLDLLTRILKPESRFVEVEFLNPELLPELVEDKTPRLDVLVLCDDGTKVDIEMQCGPNIALEQRALFYASRLYSSSLPKGQSYGQLPHCAVIFILEEAYFGQFEDGHNEFQMCRTWPTGRPRAVLRKELISLHFVELGKLRSSGANEDPILKSWVEVMLPSSLEEWDKIASEDAMFEELKKKVRRYSADHDLAMRQRAIDEGRMGRQIEMAGAFQMGKEEGLEEGRAEGRAEARAESTHALKSAVRRLLMKGMSHEEIAELFNMTEAQLDELCSGE